MKADGERLRQILMNILSNAIKYTQADGIIELRVNELNSSVLGKASMNLSARITALEFPANLSHLSLNLFQGLKIPVSVRFRGLASEWLSPKILSV